MISTYLVHSIEFYLCLEHTSWPRLTHSDHSLPKAFEFCRQRDKDVPKTFSLLYPESVLFISTLFTKFQLLYYLCVGLKKKGAITHFGFGMLHSSFSSRFYPYYYHHLVFNIMTESHSWINFSFLATKLWILIDYFIQNNTLHFCTFFR